MNINVKIWIEGSLKSSVKDLVGYRSLSLDVLPVRGPPVSCRSTHKAHNK